MENREQSQKLDTTDESLDEKDPRKKDAKKLSAEIKREWSRLTDDEINLYEKQPDQFFSKLKERYSVSKEDATKRLTKIKADCGCAEKTA